MDADVGYKFLNPKAKLAMYIKSVILIVAVIAVDAAIYIFRKEIEINDIGFFTICGISFVLIAFWLARPILFYNHYRYIVDTEKADVQRGIFIIRRTVVPIERVHQVQVRRGPISNYLGLADVVITTAGGAASIQYLDYDVAQSIADYLNDTVNKIIRDRETE